MPRKDRIPSHGIEHEAASCGQAYGHHSDSCGQVSSLFCSDFRTLEIAVSRMCSEQSECRAYSPAIGRVSEEKRVVGCEKEQKKMDGQVMQIRRIETVKIVSIYTIFGVAWIYGSDTVLGWLVRDPEIIVKIAVSKGSFFIFFTATLLYFLISRFVQQLAVAERGRLESLKNYEAIFNATNEAILIHDAHNGSIVDVNERMLEMFGYGRDEALTREIWQLSAGVSPYSQEEAVEKVRRAMLDEPQVFEWLSRKKNGELFWSEVSLKKVVTGGCDRIVAVVREISERKQAEEAVREREQFLQTILQTTADGFWVLNAEGRFVEVNDAYCAMSGYSKQELAGLHINDIEADETPHQTAERIQRISASGTDFFETHHRRKDASVFPLEVSVSFTKERGGQYVCFCRDLTERKRTEEALHTTLNGRRSFFQICMPVFSWSIMKIKLTLSTNPSANFSIWRKRRRICSECPPLK